jgi:hypothetical protein
MNFQADFKVGNVYTGLQTLSTQTVWFSIIRGWRLRLSDEPLGIEAEPNEQTLVTDAMAIIPCRTTVTAQALAGPFQILVNSRG